ncbi:MAG: hypothetical protein ACREF4_16695, partial [Gammaproteobacteria bacterium]
MGPETMQGDDEKEFGAGGSRSAAIELSNDFAKSIGSIGQKRQKALMEVQNRHNRSAAAGFYSQATDVGGVIARAAFPSRQIAVGEIFESSPRSAP